MCIESTPGCEVTGGGPAVCWWLPCKIAPPHNELPNVGGVYWELELCSVSEGMRGQWSNDHVRQAKHEYAPPFVPPSAYVPWWLLSFLSSLSSVQQCNTTRYAV